MGTELREERNGWDEERRGMVDLKGGEEGVNSAWVNRNEKHRL